MTPRFICRKKLGRWVVTYRDGDPISNTEGFEEALAVIRTIHGRWVRPANG